MTDHDNEAAHGLQASAVKQRIDSQCCGSCPGGCVVQAAKPVPPAVCEYAVNELADLRARLAKYEDAEGRPLHQGLRYTNDGELAECPCCGSLDVGGANGTVSCYSCELQITKPRPLQNAADAWNKRASLKAQPSAVDERAAFEAHMRVGGYSNPDKHPDGSYVSSAMELWWQGWKARAALSAPSHGEQVREGWKLVPVEATTEMVNALKARISCTSRGGILNAGNALNDAIAAAPSAGSQGGVE